MSRNAATSHVWEGSNSGQSNNDEGGANVVCYEQSEGDALIEYNSSKLLKGPISLTIGTELTKSNEKGEAHVQEALSKPPIATTTSNHTDTTSEVTVIPSYERISEVKEEVKRD